MDALAIINKYYPEDNELKHILLAHSRSVADKALWIAGKHPELNLDKQFLEEAAMLVKHRSEHCAPNSQASPRHVHILRRPVAAQIISRIIDHGSQLHLLGDIDATSFIQPRQ